MKNLSKRMKILIGVAGAVVVIVVVGLALGLTGNLPLQGGALMSKLSYCPCTPVGIACTFELTNYSRSTSWRLTAIGAHEVYHDRTHFQIRGDTNGGYAKVAVFGSLGVKLHEATTQIKTTCP